MKKIFIPIISLFLIASCGNKVDNSTNSAETDSAAIVENAESAGDTTDGDATNQTKEGAKAFIETVYKTYLNPTEEDEQKLDDAEITLFCMPYMGQYMSDKLQEKIIEANDKQIEEEDLFFDFDIWTNSQDDTDFKLKEINNVEFTGETATLEVVFNNGHADTKVYPIIEYNKEKNSWFVCDFLINGKKLIRSIEDYLEGDN